MEITITKLNNDTEVWKTDNPEARETQDKQMRSTGEAGRTQEKMTRSRKY